MGGSMDEVRGSHVCSTQRGRLGKPRTSSPPGPHGGVWGGSSLCHCGALFSIPVTSSLWKLLGLPAVTIISYQD